MALTAAAASSSSSSSSSSSIDPNSCKYDVFVSFRGLDTRNNFTSHLHAALKKAGILAFIDSENLERGKEISTLFTIIEESKLSIVVFSKNYASSGWCLDELACIMKCNRQKQHIVLPVFHGIEPSDVRYQGGSYTDAFVEHEKHKDKKKKVQEWRKALKAAADLSGYDLQNGSVLESKLIEKIVKEILEKLYNISEIKSDALTSLVGMKNRFEKIEPLLCVDYPDVRMIGICGMGGIGKTTLANTVYSQFYSKFEGCFFVTFREEFSEDELHQLEKNLISTLLKDKNVDHMPSSFTNDRLRRRRSFVVLDNVNQLKQLECLQGFGVSLQDRFGVGSRIILTSRDRKLLKDAGAVIHDIEAFDFNEASEFFCRKAFGGDSPMTEYVELSKKVVNYARGNPLALDVLGSHLRSRSVREWESTLVRLEKALDENIEKVLEVSYDVLDPATKAIFLDIAFFFRFEDRDLIEDILGFESHIGINILLEKSLITVNENCIIEIHDLLRQMALGIVKRESKQVEKRSRLNNAHDIYYVLKNEKGTAEIEGIFLDLSGIQEDLCLSSTVFKDMCNLRILIIHFSSWPTNFKCINFPNGSLYLPESLRYLKWHNCPWKSLENFEPINLARLEMRGSELEELWRGVKILHNLKYIDLSSSEELIQLPDLSKTPKLENINLGDCLSFHGLAKIPSSLKYLKLSKSDIGALPSSFGSVESIVTLDLQSCYKLKNLPELPKHIEILNLTDCKNLESLPSNIWKLKSLQKLNLTCCRSLKIFPEVSEVLEHLHDLSLSETGIEKLPSSVENIIGLRDLDLRDCEDLIFLPESLQYLSYLSSLTLNGCSKLGCFPSIHGLNLTRLKLGYCNIPEIPDWLGSLSSLTYLDLRGNSFETIPSSIRQLEKLDFLHIKNCKKLRHLPELPLSILALEASNCTLLETVDCSEAFKELQSWPASLNKEYEFSIGFHFYNCGEMDQSSWHNVLVYFINRVYNHPFSPEFDPVVITGYPGNEIPEWFNTQWEGSTKTIELPQNLHNYNLLGFALCVALGFRGSFTILNLYENIFFAAALHFKTNGKEKDYHLVVKYLILDEDECEHPEITIGSDHVLMWYRYDPDIQSYLMNLDEVEASIEIEDPYDKAVKVKRCGLRLIYGQEALEECPSSHEDSTIVEGQICQEIIPWTHDFASNSNSSECYSNGCLISEQPGEPTVITDVEESSMQRSKRFDICGCLPFLSIIIALLKAATGSASGGGNITVTISDGSRLFSVQHPAGLGSLLPFVNMVQQPNHFNLFPPPNLTVGKDSENNLSEEDKTRLEKFQQLRVRYLRLLNRIGGSLEDSMARQVLNRLALVLGRQTGQAFSFESAKAMALQLESEGKDDLNFSLNILVLGKQGVGKSATINSIFGEEKTPVYAFGPSTTSVKEIVGTVDGVKIRVFDTPGLKSAAMEQSANRKILSSVKDVTKKCPPDIVLYVDRLDTRSGDLNDLPLLRSITTALGPSIWRSAIVTLTHAASSPPDEPSDTPMSYELFVAQQSQIVQQTIGKAVGDLGVMNLISLVENHPSCTLNRDGEKVLPNGQAWRIQLLLLSYSMKILSEASYLLKQQESFDHKELFGFRVHSPPLPYLFSLVFATFLGKNVSGGFKIEDQIGLEKSCEVAVPAALKNKLNGQMSVRTCSSDSLQIALVAILPIIRSMFKTVLPN